MKRFAPISFWFAFAVTTALGGLGARRFSPGIAEQIRPDVFAFRDKFLGSYGPVSLDEYILAHDILGAAQQVRKKEVLLLGSSKMMYGVDAGMAQRLLETKGIVVELYNLGFGRGEGLVFPAWLIQRMGIRGKTLVIDLTDNTSQYQVKPVAEAAMKSTLLEAWKMVIETNIQYRLDWVLHSLVPRGTIDSSGIRFESNYLRPAHWRDWRTGDVFTRPGPNAHLVAPGTFPFDFDHDRRLREKVFARFRDLNLDFGFISIPYTGNDPQFAERAAQLSRCWYLPVTSSNLYTVDNVHLNKQSREVFTRGLVDALAGRLSGMGSGRLRRNPPAPSLRPPGSR